MLNDISNFIKWLLLKLFILNEVSIVTKLEDFLFFCMKAIVSVVISTLHVIWRIHIIINKARANEKNEKKIILKGNITAYIEHKHKNTGTSVLTHLPNVEKQYH